MVAFIQSGGVPVLFVLLFGVVTLVSGGLHCWRPDDRKLAFMRAMTATTLFSILTAVTANLAAVFHHVPNNPEWANSPDMPLIVMVGLGEALTPAIIGFTMLSLSWLLISIGIRRL